MKWLDPKKDIPPNERFIANIIDKTKFSYVTVGCIEGDYFYDFLSIELFYDIERGEDDQFEKISLQYVNAWMPLPLPAEETRQVNEN